jgi:hypothetical protein
MAKVRSPNYPALDLRTALQGARKAFAKDNRNKMSQAALAKHLGHDGLSGAAFGKIGALRAYGIIEGKGDELRITDDAVAALMAPEGSPEGFETIKRLAGRPKLFQDIQKDFATRPSPENLKFWLIKRQFAPDAAEKAAKIYLTSLDLAEWGSIDYDPANADHQETLATMRQEARAPIKSPSPPPPPSLPPNPGMLQEVFTLEEGPVTVTFPALLSAESYQDLADHLGIFLRKAKRRAERVAEIEAARVRLEGDDIPE